MDVLDEVIYRLDADGQIPVSVTVRRAPDGGVVVFFALVPVAEAGDHRRGAEGGITA